MLDIGNNIVGLPVEVQSIPGPRVQRQVLLRPSALLALEQAPCRALSARADRRHQAAFNQAGVVTWVVGVVRIVECDTLCSGNWVGTPGLTQQGSNAHLI